MTDTFGPSTRFGEVFNVTEQKLYHKPHIALARRPSYVEGVESDSKGQDSLCSAVQIDRTSFSQLPKNKSLRQHLQLNVHCQALRRYYSTVIIEYFITVEGKEWEHMDSTPPLDDTLVIGLSLEGLMIRHQVIDAESNQTEATRREKEARHGHITWQRET